MNSYSQLNLIEMVELASEGSETPSICFTNCSNNAVLMLDSDKINHLIDEKH